MKRNKLITGVVTGAFLSAVLMFCLFVLKKNQKRVKPNFIIIYTDDQGYNDLGCFGSQTISTPRIDQLADEGIRFTSFYTQPVSGPSRGALLTGKYPLRIGGGWIVHPEEITIAQVLKDGGYRTACIGKWDISGRQELPGLVPNDQGFQYYFGTLGANDDGVVMIQRNKDTLFTTDDMGSLTKLYTEEAKRFITGSSSGPFFLYLAHSMPHVQIGASEQFKGQSGGDLYGDVIEELDWSVGEIYDIVKELGLSSNTYILYASDNGPWSSVEEYFRSTHEGHLATGNAFPLRSSKGSPYEGGFRVPCIFWGPERVRAGLIQEEMLSNLDILPTFAALASIKRPDIAGIDGINQLRFMKGNTRNSKRKIFCYHIKGELQAIRFKDWKLMLPDTELKFHYVRDPERGTPELYNLKTDITESIDVHNEYPRIVKRLLKLAETAPSCPDPLAEPK